MTHQVNTTMGALHVVDLANCRLTTDNMLCRKEGRSRPFSYQGYALAYSWIHEMLLSGFSLPIKEARVGMGNRPEGLSC